jgi:hypothetical protein
MTTSGNASIEDLIKAYASYRSSVKAEYDEVLNEAIARAEECGSLGKYDIGALVFWKRLRADTPWAAALLSRPDSEVRAVTAAAIMAVRDPILTPPEAARRGRAALTDLPGLRSGDALASAILVAAAPDRMAIYDSRAHRALNALGVMLGKNPGRYGRYIDAVEELRTAVKASAGLEWTAREVDLALYWLGGSLAPAEPADEEAGDEEPGDE